MIVGLKESTPYVIKSSPKTKTDANWFKTELLDSFRNFFCFRVRAIIFNNRPSNVSSFKKLLEYVNQNLDELYMLHKSIKIYLRNDPVPLMKNVCNNLLKCKRLIFPPFSRIIDPSNVPGGKGM